jgi:wyosine [tRNA(Phe)-imidazoG37] synthetase (radical SAM superfamily)
MLLPLQGGILYGPVRSRRLGKSLGVNLLPKDYKLCSFNCVYCHYGWTKKHTMNVGESVEDLPTTEDVEAALERAARSTMQFDFITFSGNGEPTLHPQFTEIIEEVARIRDRHWPHVKIVLLSNSTGLKNKKVRESVSRIDIPMFKLDAGTEEKFRAMNHPAGGVILSDVMDLLCSLQDIYIQTVLIQGTPSNVGRQDLTAYFQQIKRIRPKEVHIYSIDRPVPESEIALVSRERLARIAVEGEGETGVKFRTFSV